MRAFPILIAALAAMAWAGSAEAQTRPRPRAAAPSASATAAGSGYGQRGSDIYSRPAGSTGTIYWNTPNASGNLGSPSTGGSGGGGA